MLHRSLTARILAAVAGAVLGAIVTAILLVIAGIGHWAVFAPIPAFGVLGFASGDRGVLIAAKVVEWF